MPPDPLETCLASSRSGVRSELGITSRPSFAVGPSACGSGAEWPALNSAAAMRPRSRAQPRRTVTGSDIASLHLRCILVARPSLALRIVIDEDGIRPLAYGLYATLCAVWKAVITWGVLFPDKGGAADMVDDGVVVARRVAGPVLADLLNRRWLMGLFY